MSVNDKRILTEIITRNLKYFFFRQGIRHADMHTVNTEAWPGAFSQPENELSFHYHVGVEVKQQS